MSSGNVGQDEMIEILENLFKSLNKKRALEKRSKGAYSDINSHIKADGSTLRDKDNNDDISIKKDSSTRKKDIVLPEDRLSKEEALTYLQAYKKDIDLDKFEFKSNFINENTVALNFIEKTDNQNPSRYSINFDLETNKGSINYSYFGERKGNFETVTDVEKRFNKEELIQKYNELDHESKSDSLKQNVSEKVSLVDSMTSYAKTIDLQGYQLSSKSITDNKAVLFFKHKENPGDVKEILYNPETDKGKVTHLLSNKENNYSNQKTVINEFDKTDLERQGFGKTPEQIARENEQLKVNTEDTREETEITYNQKVLDTKLGKSVTNQVLSNPELLKGAIALYQLGSMRKLLSHSKDQLENLDKLLNKKDANFEKISEIKDGLSKQIDALQERVSDLENNQETTKTYDKLNEGFQKERNDDYEKSKENTPTRTVEVEHSR